MDIITKINWIDLLVIIIIIRMSYVSFSEGLSHAILPLIGAVCVSTVSLGYYKGLSAILSEYTLGLPIEITRPAAFLTLVIITGAAFRFLKVVVDKIVKVSWFPTIEKIGGCVVGVIRASIITSLILVYLVMIPLEYFRYSIVDKSVTGIYFLGIAPAIYERTYTFLPNVNGKSASRPSGAVLNDMLSGEDRHHSESKAGLKQKKN